MIEQPLGWDDLFADNPGAISRGVANRDAKCDHFCG
jgi:hypothetical protein